MLGPSKYTFLLGHWPKPVTGHRSTRAQKGTADTTKIEDPYRNVMYDKRVIRGSNYGATAVLTDYDPLDKAAQLRRRNALRKKVLTRNLRNVIGTPSPVFGRRHEIVQTDKFLEELLEHPPVRSTDTQTDLFLEQPPSPPPYIASSIGIDVGTSIEAGDLDIKENETADEGVEEPLIEHFIEACILDTAHEVECENYNDKTNDEMTSSHHPWLSEQVADEVAQIVDSQEILGVIIEEIIKQRTEAYVAETDSEVEDDIDDIKTL